MNNARKIIMLAAGLILAAVTHAGEVGGQVFITTAGAGAYKFAGAKVVAYETSDYNAALERQKGRLPTTWRRAEPNDRMGMEAKAWEGALQDVRPVAVAMTDADGKWSMKIPDGKSVFLVCYTTRATRRMLEQNLWVVSVESATVMLSGDNQWQQPD